MVVSILNLIGLVGFLVAAAVIDQRTQKIPNRLLIWMLAYRGVTLLVQILLDTDYMKDILMEALLGGLIVCLFLPVWRFSKGGIGMGDLKLFAVVGLYVGRREILPVMLISLVLAFAVMVWKRIRGKLARGEAISFGPFIAAGTLLEVLAQFAVR